MNKIMIPYEQLLNKYIDYIYTTGRSYDHIGRSIKAVRDFLSETDSVSKRGYNAYRRQNAVLLYTEPYRKEALCDFLEWQGVGFGRKRRTQSLKPLEKLSVISEKNRKLMNDFIYYLTQEEDYSPHTLSLYSFSVKKYFEYANEISFDNYKRFIHTLEEQGMSPATIRLRITAIERLSEFAGKPIKLKRPKFKRKLDTDNVPTEQEYERLLEFLRTKKNQDYYFFIKVLPLQEQGCPSSCSSHGRTSFAEKSR